MSKKVIWITAIVILLVIIVIIRFQAGSSEANKKGGAAPAVSIGKPVRGEMEYTILLTGDVSPVKQAMIYTKVSGNIEREFVDIGSAVGQGQLLALIDTSIYSQNMKQAYGSYLQAEANYINTKANYERNASLLNKNLIARQDLDNAKTAFDVAIAQREVSLANYKNTQTQLSYCKITAPFSGTITKRFYDAGTYVTAGQPTTSALFTLMDVNALKIMANIPERDIAAVAKVREADITVDALPDKHFSGKITKTSESVDLSTRTMVVQIDVNNPGHLLKPGMFANVTFVLDKKENTLKLPTESVQKDEKGWFVYTLPDSTVHKQYIQIGLRQEKEVEIISGVTENDKVVVAGQTLIKDKMKVRVVR
ncbi:MAG: efflux RND transporter periplasmic adaptor subunit [Ignavibacteria bacterium]|nr:efflux RND transporter periplasmic adaptor subunit [Ignavibacteria bacterium]